ncbi:MAG: hypothetical protein KF729_21025 [Sandaracinaceae bacterium]|nr:hypothetical protein [Sandaracinaceae bacterium]
MSIARRSGELVLLPVLDPNRAAPFYEQLGFRVTSEDPEEVVLEKPGMQLVLERVDVLERDDGRPRIEIMVDIDVLDRIWRGDSRDEPTLPGPTLAPEGVFEYRARDPSGNRVRITAPLPEPDVP